MQVAVADDLATGRPLAGDQDVGRRREISPASPFRGSAQVGQHAGHGDRDAVRARRGCPAPAAGRRRAARPWSRRARRAAGSARRAAARAPMPSSPGISGDPFALSITMNAARSGLPGRRSAAPSGWETRWPQRLAWITALLARDVRIGHDPGDQSSGQPGGGSASRNATTRPRTRPSA